MVVHTNMRDNFHCASFLLVFRFAQPLLVIVSLANGVSCLTIARMGDDSSERCASATSSGIANCVRSLILRDIALYCRLPSGVLRGVVRGENETWFGADACSIGRGCAGAGTTIATRLLRPKNELNPPDELPNVVLPSSNELAALSFLLFEDGI